MLIPIVLLSRPPGDENVPVPPAEETGSNENFLDTWFPTGFRLQYSDQSDELRERHRAFLQAGPSDVEQERTEESLPQTNVNFKSRHRSLNHDHLPRGGALTLQKANQLLSRFKELNPPFPFVSVPKDTTVEEMSEEQPFLLLAALTVASMPEYTLYRLLNERFRTVLSARIIIKGEKGLDYLQGLIVYLAWYIHFYTVPHCKRLTEHVNESGIRCTCAH